MTYALTFVGSIALFIALMMSIPKIFSWGMRHFRNEEEKKWKKERGL